MRRLIERYRLPESFAKIDYPSSENGKIGFFSFEGDVTCFGTCSTVSVTPLPGDTLPIVRLQAGRDSTVLHLPFDPDEVVDNLLLERYSNGDQRARLKTVARDLYYALRPWLTVRVREHLQRVYLQGWNGIRFPNWPIDCTVERLFERLLILMMREQGLRSVPFIWFWPEGADSCAIVTHDVETKAGRDFCSRLMTIDERWGIRSSFQVIPEERYDVSEEFLVEFRDRGFEVNVHDLNHDGRLFWDRRRFSDRASRINRYGQKFQATGFRSGAMYRNQDWCRDLHFEYDMSVPNAAHLEPQHGGCCTVMPYFNGNLLELPLTVSQDYALFHLLNTRSMDLWEEQLAAIRREHGLISILVHPDYVMEKREEEVYQQLLSRIADLRDHQNVWTATPGEVNTWWRIRNGLMLVQEESGWRIEGQGSDRARLAYAMLDGDRITYRVEGGNINTSQVASDIETGITTCAKEGVRVATLTEDMAVERPQKARKAGGGMNICMVTHSFYDTDNRVMRYAETLSARGNHVDVISLRLFDDEPNVVLNGVNVIKIQTRDRDVKSRRGHLFPVLKFLLRASWILAKRHRKSAYDVVHVHSVPDFMVFAAWLPKLTGAKVILDIHDILPELYASKFGVARNSIVFKVLLAVERVSALMADHVIIANDIWRERLLARSVPEDKCTCILNFPNREIFHKSGIRRSDGKFLILYPGTLNHHQGLDIALRAFAKIAKQVPQAEFHIYGRGPDREKLIDQAEELHLGHQFVLHDVLPLRQIAGVMETADLGIVPKRGDTFGDEAFSTKTLEFMSLGVPIIVAATTIDKYYFNDSLVRFFRCGDEDDLSKAMLELISNPELRRRLVQNGLEFAMQNDWEHNEYRYLDILDSLSTKRA
jgi:glycosyltransferase involved in cell wall biosynthesis